MITVSTLDAAKRGYHHGDLRSAAIEEGLRLLEDRVVDDIGLRELARAIGVSASALYRHFPDKEALRQALAEEGLVRLAKAQGDAQAHGGSGMDGFNATGRAYVQFALDNPGLFRLMFSSLPTVDALGGLEGKHDEAMQLLQRNAAELVSCDVGPAAAQLFALRAWALVHGLAVLLLDKQIAGNADLIDAVIDAKALVP
ncbi:MAG: TetR/AcrR family transcriptional regulator [Novosphingobium sp.]